MAQRNYTTITTDERRGKAHDHQYGQHPTWDTHATCTTH